MKELKTCPFCGGDAEIHACAQLENEGMAARYNGEYGVHCTICHVATLPYRGKDAAITAWNRRADDEA